MLEQNWVTVGFIVSVKENLNTTACILDKCVPQTLGKAHIILAI